MKPTKFSSLCVLIVVTGLAAAPAGAQKPSPEQKPDLSNKALITKETPDPKKKTRETKAVKQYTIEQFMETTRLGGSSFSSDEKSILFYSNKTGIFNVYSMPVAGGAPGSSRLRPRRAPTRFPIFPTMRGFFTAMTKAATRTNTFICGNSTEGSGPDPGRKDQGTVPRLEP